MNKETARNLLSMAGNSIPTLCIYGVIAYSLWVLGRGTHDTCLMDSWQCVRWAVPTVVATALVSIIVALVYGVLLPAIDPDDSYSPRKKKPVLWQKNLASIGEGFLGAISIFVFSFVIAWWYMYQVGARRIKVIESPYHAALAATIAYAFCVIGVTRYKFKQQRNGLWWSFPFIAYGLLLSVITMETIVTRTPPPFWLFFCGFVFVWVLCSWPRTPAQTQGNRE